MHAGDYIREHRGKRLLTQAQLAELAGINRDTVGEIEVGRGSLQSLGAVMGVLNLIMIGLPRGRTVGERIARKRRGRRYSQRKLARLVGVSPPTISALEQHGRGRVVTLFGVCAALGVTLRIIESGLGGSRSGRLSMS